jgi:DNA-binding NtrC family response regulator
MTNHRDSTSLTTANVLIVDDEPLITQTLAEYLGQEGFQVATCGDAESAIALANERHFDVVLCDVQLPGIDGIQLLDRVLKVDPETQVVLITAYGTIENAIEAFQRGAQDYLLKPLVLDEVGEKIRRLLSLRELKLENQWLRRELNREYDFEHMVGRGPEMLAIRDLIRKVAPTPSTVLIEGESGTGKELVARAIHQQSDRCQSRFVALNCAAIPHDLLENQLFGHRRGAFTGADRDHVGVLVHAGGGTVFLDEIGDLPPATQGKILRALEQKEILPIGANEPIRFEARILAATNRDLLAEVEAGRFRDDLYYRLNVFKIRLPPLRTRRDDIPELVDFLLAKQAQLLGRAITGVTHETMQILTACPWKGNVRELENILQRAVILAHGPLITPADLPPDLAPVPDDPALVDELAEAVRRFERQHIERVLRQTADKKEAARRLGMALSSLYRKIAELGIVV